MTVKETIECLKKCPQNDILMVDMGDKLESLPVYDVLCGCGTIKGFSYIKPEYTEESNGDKIRNMPNEELAMFLAKIDNGGCYGERYYDMWLKYVNS